MALHSLPLFIDRESLGNGYTQQYTIYTTHTHTLELNGTRAMNIVSFLGSHAMSGGTWTIMILVRFACGITHVCVLLVQSYTKVQKNTQLHMLQQRENGSYSFKHPVCVHDPFVELQVPVHVNSYFELRIHHFSNVTRTALTDTCNCIYFLHSLHYIG